MKNVISCSLFLFFLLSCKSDSNIRMRFDSDLWKLEGSKAPIQLDGKRMTLRHLMLQSLLENFLPNKSLEEIKDLLGPSDYDPIFLFKGAEPNYRVPNLIYMLGTSPKHPIDIDILYLWFDERSKFEKYKIESS